MGTLAIVIALGNNMLVTYFISFFILWIPIISLEKYLWHADFETTLLTTVFIAGAAVVIAMENHLRNIKMIIKNAFRKKIK